jgi:hypothetical protein
MIKIVQLFRNIYSPQMLILNLEHLNFMPHKVEALLSHFLSIGFESLKLAKIGSRVYP